MQHRTDWAAFEGSPGARSEFKVASAFIRANGERTLHLFGAARLACIPFTLLGGVLIYRWANEMFGTPAALVGTALWAFCPSVIGNGSLITPDAGASSCGAAAIFLFWRWLHRPHWFPALTAGLALSIAEAVKAVWCFLFLLLPLMWAVFRFTQPRRRSWLNAANETGQLLGLIAMAILVINLVYGFDGAGRTLGAYRFSALMFRGAASGIEPDSEAVVLGNRFKNDLLRGLPVPFPEQYVLGIDMQRRAVEFGGMNYLFGEWKHGGWWYYYLAAATVKVPLGVWVLVLLAITTRICGMRFGPSWRDELVLLAPAIATLIFISSQTGINRHFRYALPIFPFLFVWVSSLAQLWTTGPKLLAWLATGAWGWAIASSLFVYPHSLSYFNELAGGPRGGPRFLLGSNTDWGQDLLFLKKWIDAHPEARPLTVGWHMKYLDTTLAGVDFPQPPTTPQPGWHVISVNEIYNYEPTYHYFQDFKPVDCVGYSMNVYHLTEEDVRQWHANRKH